MRAKEIRFIKWVKKQCKENGIKCDLRNVKYLKLSGNIRCSGYFDEESKQLVVAMNRPDWLGILVHEYCHLTQWTDGVKVWTDTIKRSNRLVNHSGIRLAFYQSPRTIQSHLPRLKLIHSGYLKELFDVT